MKLIKSNIPNLLTLSSLFLGFSSILASIQAVNDLFLHSVNGNKIDEANPERFLAFAGLSILFCTLFDFLDGYFARLFKVGGELGRQLDSLTDLVSFGLAPGVLFFTVTMIVTGHIPESGIFYQASKFIPEALLPQLVVFKLFAFIFPTCAMIRLAKFNVKAPSRVYFEGLPSTFAGGLIALFLSFNFYITPLGKLFDIFNWTIPISMIQTVGWFESIFQNYFFLFFTYMIISISMISKIKFIKINVILKPFLNRKGIPFLILNLVLIILLFKYYLMIMGLTYLFLANSWAQRNNAKFFPT